MMNKYKITVVILKIIAIILFLISMNYTKNLSFWLFFMTTGWLLMFGSFKVQSLEEKIIINI